MNPQIMIKSTKKQASGNQQKRRVYEGHDVDGLLDDFEGIGLSMVAEINRRLPYMASDLIDGLTFKSFSSAFAMFFATYFATLSLATHIEQATYYRIGVSEYILMNAVAGMVHSLFGAQPLLILRPSESTTLMIIFLSKTADMFGFDFYELFAATGYFLGANLILISVTEASRFLRFVTRFTYELFIIFICSLYIYDGVGDILGGFKSSSTVDYSESEEDGTSSEAALGKSLFMACLATVTFVIALYLHHAVHWVVFTKDIRQVISDYALIVSVLVSTLLSYSLSVAAKEVERVDMPNGFGATCMHSRTLDDAYATQQCFSTESGLGEQPRSWLVQFESELSINIWILAFFCSLPISFLFFMDQNVAALLSQQSHNKLRKGSYYHFSFLILGLINTIGPSFGLPFVSGSSPHSHQFVRYLTTYNSDFSVRYVNENRLAPFIVYLLVGLSVFFPNLLGMIPLGTIRGVLTFIGVVGVTNCQLWDRFVCLFRPPSDFVEKYNRRGVAGFRVHLYTMLQICIFACCWIINLSPGGIFVAFVIASLAPIRIYLLPFLFSENELSVLEDDSNEAAAPRIVARDTASALETSLDDSSIHSCATDASALPLMDTSGHEDDSFGRGSSAVTMVKNLPAALANMTTSPPPLPFSVSRAPLPEKPRGPIGIASSSAPSASPNPITYSPKFGSTPTTSVAEQKSTPLPPTLTMSSKDFEKVFVSTAAAVPSTMPTPTTAQNAGSSEAPVTAEPVATVAPTSAPENMISPTFIAQLPSSVSTAVLVPPVEKAPAAISSSESAHERAVSVSVAASASAESSDVAATDEACPSDEGVQGTVSSSSSDPASSSIAPPVVVSDVPVVVSTGVESVEVVPAPLATSTLTTAEAPQSPPVVTRLTGPIAGVLRAGVPVPPRPGAIGITPMAVPGSGQRPLVLPVGAGLPPRTLPRPQVPGPVPGEAAVPGSEPSPPTEPTSQVAAAPVDESVDSTPAPAPIAATAPRPFDPALLSGRPRVPMPMPRPGIGAVPLPGLSGTVGARPMMPTGRPLAPPRLPPGMSPAPRSLPTLPPGVVGARAMLPPPQGPMPRLPPRLPPSMPTVPRPPFPSTAPADGASVAAPPTNANVNVAAAPPPPSDADSGSSSSQG